MSDRKQGFETIQIHAGQSADPATGASAVPIYQTTSFVFESVDSAAEIFSLEKPGNIYTRIMNPTTDALEQRLAAMEGGSGALAFSSGMSAIFFAIQNLAKCGDEIISIATLYGGTYTLFSNRLPQQYGINVKFVDPEDFAALENAITDKTRCVFIETLGNPLINIPDIERIAMIAHKHGLPVMADNTFATGYLIQLRDFGVDISVHSITKYIGGHGNSIGGAVIDLGTFNWRDNPRFPDFNTPDEAYHGLVYADKQERAYITKLRAQSLRDIGAALSPFNAWMFLMGCETLSLRMERHCQNAEAIGEYLAAHPDVAWVNYPALPGDAYHERARKYLPNGCGAIMAFGVKGGIEACKRFVSALKLFTLLANVADSRSLVIHPASTTHSQLSEEQMLSAGVRPDMIRMSVGLETIGDLIADLEQALKASQAK